MAVVSFVGINRSIAYFDVGESPLKAVATIL